MTLQINNPRFGNVFATADTFAELRSITTKTIHPGYSAIVMGGLVAGDNLGGVFVWIGTLTDADDGFEVIAPSDGQPGRWKKITAGQTGPAGPQGEGLSTVTGPGGAGLVGHKSNLNATVPRTVMAKLNETVSVKDFGAKGDGVADDRVAIQTAIDTVSAAGGGTVRIPVGTYMLSLTLAVDGGVVGLLLRSNVSVVGESMYASVLKLLPNSTGPGTYLRIIASAGQVQKVNLQNFTLDGNRSGQGVWAKQGNGGNIVFDLADGLIDHVRSIEANGQGIQVRGDRNAPSRGFVIQNCKTDGMSGSTLNVDGTVALEHNGNGIGIQVSQATDYKIVDNTISNCKDNGIDTYNENVDYSTNPPTVGAPTGGTAIISGNTITASRCGIFPETTGRMIVSNNYVNGMTEAGIAINRINSAPDLVSVTGNTVEYCQDGIRVTGNTDSLRISDNWIGFITSGSGAGIRLDNSSYVLIERNVFKIPYLNVPLVAFQGSQGVFCCVTGNYYWNKPSAGYLTYQGSDSMFGTTVEDWRSVSALDAPFNGEGRFSRNFGYIGNLETSTLKSTGPVGFNNATPSERITLPGNATDLVSTQALANSIRALLINFGLGA